MDNRLAGEKNILSNQFKMTKPNLFDELVDQYKLEKHLGQQTTTDLYLAYDVDENRAVAIEILLPHLAQNKTYAEQFMAKMRRVAQLKHPNIAQVLQVGTTPTHRRPYIARDHFESYFLRERLQQLAKQNSPVNSVYALKLVRQIAEALDVAERLDIYHYGLTPESIMLQMDGNVVLHNLGLPPTAASPVKSESNGDGKSLHYLSPEQLQGKSIDARSHVYSIGVLLYELLVGDLPDTPASLWSTLKSAPLSTGTTDLKKARPDLSPQTYRLVERCLRRLPWSRYQSSSQLLEALDEAIKAEDFLIRTGGVRAMPRPSSTRLALAVISTVVLLVLCASAIIIWWPDDQMASVGNGSLAQVTAADPATVLDPVANSSPTPTDTPAPPVFPPGADIRALGPPPDQQFRLNETIFFSWTWPQPLTPGLQFLVYGYVEDGPIVLGRISQAVGGQTYGVEAPASLFATDGRYQWQIVLEDASSGVPLLESPRYNILIAAEPTATPAIGITPTSTIPPTETMTPSPTPPPMVMVMVASASLRTGPGVNYAIVRFLNEGEVVTVIGIDPRREWYNVQLGSGVRGWLSVITATPLDATAVFGVPTAATIPASPTPTNTATPLPTNTPTPVPTQPPIVEPPPPAPTSPPPTPTVPPPPTLTPPSVPPVP